MRLKVNIFTGLRTAVLLTGLISTPLFAADQKKEEALQAFVIAVSKKVDTQWRLMEKVWPGHNYKDINLLVISVNHRDRRPRYWLINTAQLSSLPADKVKNISVPPINGFNLQRVEGKRGIVIAIDSQKLPESVEETFRLATHELVHGWFQQDVAPGAENESRDTIYPLDYHPRLYRFMVIKKLQQAVRRSDSQEALCEAKYWFDKWRAEHGDEYRRIKQIDIAEGSARYIETLSVYVEDGKSLRQIRARILPTLRVSLEQNISLDGESYLLGEAAGLLLDDRQPEWKTAFYKNNVPPAEMLLQTLKGCRSRAYASPYEKALMSRVMQENKRLAQHFTVLSAALRDRNVAWLRLENSLQTGNQTNVGFYRFNGKSVIASMSATFQGKDGQLTIANYSVIDENRTLLIPLPPSAVYRNGVLILMTPQLRGAWSAEPFREADQRIVYRTR